LGITRITKYDVGEPSIGIIPIPGPMEVQLTGFFFKEEK
jgi:hypothetical protein